ncbi:alkaline phosphatase D family protein [Psychrobium sp. 1_MG-2023]|uniref:alkaline phosphatase D family protein n=1 Tax=Psychrobium sp. 1_MG-2023 TaxID=3062624 RepID=UPI002733879A|nr:alkaline phosphatase D family protein [Psychrobium sp. 1_MG-2023]MDP2562828.1 alkaline phosphatase D family protein [Psychrobium sp. 1_MG-2023]
MLSEILAGPILRRVTAQQFTLWWVSPFECQGTFSCYQDEQVIEEVKLTSDVLTTFRVGKYAVIHLLDVKLSLPQDTYLEYDLHLQCGSQVKSLAEIASHLVYAGKKRPSLMVQLEVDNLLHGSCRNPHHDSDDSLLAGDRLVGSVLDDNKQRPALLMMSGDQIYADHVAGPTLYAIHQVIALLGLHDETFIDANIGDSEELHQLAGQYYQRENILPQTSTQPTWYRAQQKQAIFTSTYAHNHLISFAETIAMYLLVWSPTLWQEITFEGVDITPEHQALWDEELVVIRAFVSGLDKVQRLLAHVPTYMIFDDHDVTDDWNLTAGWEQAAYNNPFAKRIIGNTLFGYWLCQGWGNDPARFKGDFWQIADQYQQHPNQHNQERFIDHLLQFSGWQYTVETQPKLVVLDSRTRRWRSETDINHPSGLMDWEAMCELQQELIGHDSIILVSPAPIFGVKVIETIQRMVTACGHPLAVDAENWMAHPGSASTMLNIFKHPRTPQHFIILSGDVHYSFVYDIELRFSDQSPKIWQITSSGIKNQFPQPLIGILDKLNRWLYGSLSPLNFFTKRRAMRVKGRNLANNNKVRLSEQSGLGYLELNSDGSPKLICDLHVNGGVSEFIEGNEELIH